MIDCPNMTSIILGDFNDNLLLESNTKLLNFMSSHGYSQLVNYPTTDSSSLIDYVYCNRPSKYNKVHVTDIYYSDHDLICAYLSQHD